MSGIVHRNDLSWTQPRMEMVYHVSLNVKDAVTARELLVGIMQLSIKKIKGLKGWQMTKAQCPSFDVG